MHLKARFISFLDINFVFIFVSIIFSRFRAVLEEVLRPLQVPVDRLVRLQEVFPSKFRSKQKRRKRRLGDLVQGTRNAETQARL